MTRSRKVWIAVIALLIVAIGGAAVRAVAVSGRWRASTTTYSTATVTRGTLEVTVGGTGSLVPLARQDAVSSSAATVDSVIVKAGDAVTAGQVLLRLSSDSLADQVALSRLDVRLAEIDLEAATDPGESVATEADIAATEAAVENARVAAENARRNVDDLMSRAPFAGRVSDITVRAGDEVGAGAPLYTIFTPDSLLAILYVPESFIDEVALGDEVTVTVRAISRDFEGRVTAVSSQSTTGDRGAAFRVTVALEGSDRNARAGMTASTTFPVDSSWPGLTAEVGGVLAYDRSRTAVATARSTVIAVMADEGGSVDAGQTIMTLESAEAEAALARAEADLARAEQSLADLLEPGVPRMTQAQVEKVRLRYEEAVLRLGGLERQLDELTVRAKFDGIVTDVLVVTGDSVTPGQRLLSLADLSEATAVITVDELEVAGLAPGEPATVRVDAFPGESFQGVVESVSLEGLARDGVTSYEARIRLPGDPRMRAGMSVSATILVARRENALLVPVEAVYGAGREAVVQVMVDGEPVARGVVAGLSSSTQAEIVEGLQEGETVVTGSLEVDNSPFGPPSSSGHPGGGGGD